MHSSLCSLHARSASPAGCLNDDVLAVTIGVIDCSPKWGGDDLCHDGARYGEKQSGGGVMGVIFQL